MSEKKRWTSASTLAMATVTAVAATTLIAAPASSTPSSKNRPTTQAASSIKVDRTERERIRAQYGVYPLPIGRRAIERWKLGRKGLKRIAAARRLAESPKGRSVRKCESHHNYRLVYGSYYGAWQFDRQTWLSNGGGRFARTANKAPSWAQDLIMWKTHQARGWQPWGCA
ncbi:MAG: transglycosylase family protein [Candidatus Nanopelagicales bacterium]|nr:transglycosylase family protein [Candidatus Nanopelagicales bacterium]